VIQVVAVETIEVLSSVAFQAFEEGLLGVVQTVDSVATTLASTGDLAAATRAGVQTAQVSATKSLNYVVTAVTDAVANIAATLHNPESPSMTRGGATVRSDSNDTKTHTLSQILRKTDPPRNLTKQEGAGPAKPHGRPTRPNQMSLTSQEGKRPAQRLMSAIGQAVRNTIKADRQDIPNAFNAAREADAPRELKAPKLTKPPRVSKATEVSRGHKAHRRASPGRG
jgi:type II secretory pathway component GspD/PulD (secretin)